MVTTLRTVILGTALIATGTPQQSQASERGLAGPSVQTIPLRAYVGKYPSDKVGGVDFLHHPLVRQAILGAVLNQTVLATVLGGGVEGPIQQQGQLIVADICEPHNCADHQWRIVLLAPAGRAAVCYHDADLMGQEGRWFIAGSAVYRTINGCWAGSYTPLPDRLVAMFAREHP